MLPRLLQDFITRRAGVYLQLDELTTERRIEAFAAGEIDVGITRELGKTNASSWSRCAASRSSSFFRIAIVPATVRALRQSGVAYLPLADRGAVAELALAFPADRESAVLREFVQTALDSGRSDRSQP